MCEEQSKSKAEAKQSTIKSKGKSKEEIKANAKAKQSNAMGGTSLKAMMQWNTILREWRSSAPKPRNAGQAMDHQMYKKRGAGNGTLMTSSVAGQKQRGTCVENCIAFLATSAEAFSAKAGTGPADRPWATSRACGISTRWLG